MAAVICGSLAFDTIMNFEGQFADQILADQLHNLNVSFLVPSLRREFGGCAANIAYGLKQLGGDPVPVAAVGTDGADYVSRLQDLGIDTTFVHEIEGSYTAQALIMNDRRNNQITAFHPGAMSFAHRIAVEARSDFKLGIVSPDGRDAMLLHAAQFKAAGVPFIFDPGQGLPMFNGDELRDFVDQADWIAVNDYEGQMLVDRAGLSLAELSTRVRGLIVTLGENGCDVWVDGQATRVEPVVAVEVVDPTGCGDAFRSALLYGLERGWDLVRAARLGNRIGAIKIAVSGPQNYRLNLADVLDGI